MNPGLRTLELLSIAILIGASAAIGVPKYQTVQRESVATAMLEDVEHVRKAVYAFYADSAYFPAELPGGELPEPLLTYLPRGFSTRRPVGTVTYRNWPVRMIDTATVAVDTTRVIAPMDTLATAPDTLLQADDSASTGIADSVAAAAADSARRVMESLAREASAAPRGVQRSNVIAVVVTPTDPRVGETAYLKARDVARFVVGNQYAFVLFGG